MKKLSKQKLFDTDIESIEEIVAALRHADKKHGQIFNSRHEAYAVLLEELDELWDEIKTDGPNWRVRDEAAQVAAMVIKLLRIVPSDTCQPADPLAQ